MKTKILLSILFLISIGIGVGFATTLFHKDEVFRADPVQAVNEDTSPLSKEISHTNSLSISSMEPSSANTISNQDPSLEVGIKTVQPSPVEVLQGLNRNALATLRTGWVHLHEEKHLFTDIEDNGVLPNGAAIPNDQINDIWFNIGPDNHVLQTISIMRTIDGQIVQVGVISNGKTWNSATNEVQAADIIEFEGFDSGLLRDLQRLQAFGAEVEISDKQTPDGHEGIQVIIRDIFDAPMKDEVFSRPIIAAETLALFSKETGYLIQKEIVFTFDDDSQRIFSQVIQEIKFEQPTEDVLGYLVQLERR